MRQLRLLGALVLLAPWVQAEKMYYALVELQVERAGVSESYAHGLAESLRSLVRSWFSERPVAGSDQRASTPDPALVSLRAPGRSAQLLMHVAVTRADDIATVSVALLDQETKQQYLEYHYEGPFFHPARITETFAEQLGLALGESPPPSALPAPSANGLFILLTGLHLEQIAYESALLSNYPDLQFDLDSTPGFPVSLSRRFHLFRTIRAVPTLVCFVGSVVVLCTIPVGPVLLSNNADGHSDRALQNLGFTITVGLCASGAGLVGMVLSTPVGVVRDINEWLGQQ